MSNISDYKEIQSINQPDETLLKNIGLVKRVALHLQGRIPKFMELDELIQVGTIGLIEASKSFDANKGVDFEILTLPGFNSNDVLLKSIKRVQEFFNIDNWQINQPIILSDLYTELSTIMGLQSIVNIEIFNLQDTQSGYSGNIYDINQATRNQVIYPSLDPSIFEIKYPNSDIKGRVVSI